MFGLFGKKKLKPSVTPEDKDWIEKSIAWLIECFGVDRLLNKPFYYPIQEEFPYQDLNNEEEFQSLFVQLCGYINVKPEEIEVRFFDDLKSQKWSTWILHTSFDEPAGLYSAGDDSKAKKFHVQLAKSNLANPELLVTVLSHELMHVKLLGGEYVNQGDVDMEHFTDLAIIYFGFGIFMANTCYVEGLTWITRTGYLPNEVISYANALILYITKQNPDIVKHYLNENTRAIFVADCEYLTATNDTYLTKNVVDENVEIFDLNTEYIAAYDKRDYMQAIEAYKKLLSKNPKNPGVLNNIGYCYLLKKEYAEAIPYFTKAVEIDPYFDYSINNRGYCNLQLGNLDDAFTDIYSSYKLNPDNAYSLRNLGAYYLAKGDYSKALTYLESAEKIDPATEMINFYLSKAHTLLGNTDKAAGYAQLSLLFNEYNDSMLSL